MGAAAGYMLIFVLLYPVWGASLSPLSAAPVVMAGWFFGLRAGVVAALLALLCNTLLFNLEGYREGGWDVALRGGGGLETVALSLLGVGTGTLLGLRERARRGLAERKQAEEALRFRTQEMETLFHIARVLAGLGSFEEKVARVLGEVARVAEGFDVVLRTLDENEQGLRLIAGIAAGTEEMRRIIPYSDGVAGQLFQRREPVIINDYAAYPQARPHLLALGVKSALGLPIKVGGVIQGTLAIGARKPGHFTPERVRLLEAIADGMGALLENARLSHELAAQLEQGRQRLNAFHMAASHLDLTEDPDRALQGLVELARGLVGARHGALALWDVRDHLEKWIVAGSPSGEQPGAGAPLEEGMPLAIEQARRESLDQAAPHQHSSDSSPLIPHLAVKRSLGVPFRFRGRSTGSLYFMEKEGATGFSGDDQRLLNLFAMLAGVLLDNVRLHADVARERATLNALHASMTEGLAVIDAGGCITYSNRAAEVLVGAARQRTPDKPIGEVFSSKRSNFESPQMAEDLLQAISSSDAQEGPATVAVRVLRPHARELAVTVFPILRKPQPKMTGLLVRDVTREREIERRRDAFVAVASHELRTPLTTMVGFAELLLRRDPPEPVRREWLDYIYKGSREMMAVVDELLSVSRIQSGELAIDLESVPLQAVLDEVLAGIRPATDRHEFRVDIPQTVSRVWADRGKLVQVLTNLLDNAVKYSPRGGTVAVSARHEPERRCVVVSVADQGIGIAPADQGRLFTTFYRVPRRETESVRGTGLGLYIVKALMELMQGEVWLESQVGQGSTFFLSLLTGPAREAEGRASRLSR
jgi:signal transduction histidine kinase